MNGLNFIQTLRDTDQPVRRYILRAWMIAFIPSILVSMLVYLLFKNPGLPTDLRKMPVGVMIFGVLLFSPVVETLLMWGGIAILKLFSRNVITVSLLSALVWALLHSMMAAAWGLGVFWPFFVFSLAFLEWEKKSRLKAIGIVMMIHALQNLIPAVVLAVGGGGQ